MLEDCTITPPLHFRAAFFGLMFIAAVFFSCTAQEKLSVITIEIQREHSAENAVLSVEAAVTAKEQQQGFMHRTEIPEGTGMIFLYTHDTRLRFWMKNTPHPLSIAFIDSRGKIREIRDMQPFSLETVTSMHSVRYALEVPQGYFERAGITIGDRLTKDSLHTLQTLLLPAHS